MDPSSVISQVERPTTSGPGAKANNNEVTGGVTAVASPPSANAAHNEADGLLPVNAQKDSKKKKKSGSGSRVSASSSAQSSSSASARTRGGNESNRARNIFCSVLCCFGKRPGARGKPVDGKNAGSATANGGDASDGGRTSTAGGLAAGVAALGLKGKQLLAEARPEHKAKQCIVIDLDETLVHSSFKPINNADFIVPVEIDGTIHQVYVLKRPHVDEFLCRMGDLFECVLFTASLAKYADPVADLLDKWDVFHARLFRESCVFHRGNYVKDLGRLGRDLHKIIIVDNSPASYIFHPENAVPVSSWFDDLNDRELLDLIPFLENLSKVDNVYAVLAQRNRPMEAAGAVGAGVAVGGAVVGAGGAAGGSSPPPVAVGQAVKQLSNA